MTTGLILFRHSPLQNSPCETLFQREEASQIVIVLVSHHVTKADAQQRRGGGRKSLVFNQVERRQKKEVKVKKQINYIDHSFLSELVTHTFPYFLCHFYIKYRQYLCMCEELFVCHSDFQLLF